MSMIMGAYGYVCLHLWYLFGLETMLCWPCVFTVLWVGELCYKKLNRRLQSLEGQVWCLLALFVCPQMTYKSNPRSACLVTVRAAHFCTSNSWLKTGVPFSFLSRCPLIFPLLSSLAFKDFHPFMNGTSPSIPLQSLMLPGLWMDETLLEALVKSVLVSFPLATLCSLSIFQLGIHDLFW